MKLYYVTVPPENLRTWFTRRADADFMAKYCDGATVTKMSMPQRNPSAISDFLNRYARGPAPIAGELADAQFFDSDASQEIDRLTSENDQLKHENTALRGSL